MRVSASRFVIYLAVGAAFFPVRVMGEETHGSSGLPQMDTSFYVGQVFWLIVCFLTFAMVVAWYVLPNVRATYRARKTLLDDDHAAARRDQESAEVLLKEYERSMVEANSKADALVEETLKRVKAMLDKERDQAQERLEKRVFVAETAARVRLHDALSRVDHEVEMLAPMIVDQALRMNENDANQTEESAHIRKTSPSVPSVSSPVSSGSGDIS